eukprot:5756818-Prymnesium_polylepis.1
MTDPNEFAEGFLANIVPFVTTLFVQKILQTSTFMNAASDPHLSAQVFSIVEAKIHARLADIMAPYLTAPTSEEILAKGYFNLAGTMPPYLTLSSTELRTK